MNHTQFLALSDDQGAVLNKWYDGAMTYDKGSTKSKSTKQEINTKSSSET